ncbi:uroporphyrinogen decarboxylase [Phosphitispora fastidiosa]|uniref:uroporphyrinogen decarboxylase n=1 Tax=Phosphitispora fastidiosa TaxID=2837202 RepID=UPI001E35A29B|nr:uroporphyrinogen decarboxylase [Phosphitispora fastidiosa]MBU7006500.1 uroporphyrinogen decarboxylase [Phosphitispora fastidiosa]
MQNDRFLKACRREEVDCTPVWLMRQAGRYLPEYMEIRQKYDFLTMCKTPDLAAEVTLQPVNRLGVDAAILFADILLPLEGMGIELAFAKNEGPVISNPVRTKDDVDKIRILEAEEATPYVLDAIRLIRKELEGRVPLIGFSGAPFTIASYIIEGGGSKDYKNCKSMMWQAPDVWDSLMKKISEVLLKYLKAQIKAGAQAVQMFDSWVGALSPDDYEQYVLPHSKYVLDGLRDEGVPVIHFANNASSMLELVAAAGGDVIGLDWRINLDDAWKRVGYDRGVQGNLDPFTLFAPPSVIEEKVRKILDMAGNRPGHIFNLGHGINKETPVEHAIALVEAVHKYSRR